MIEIFPYMVVGLVGYLIGVGVNFVIEWLYQRREAYTSEQVEAIKKIGWLKYLAWPFSTGRDRFWQKLRILLVEIIFIAAAVWLWASPPEAVAIWWGIPVLVYFAIVIVMDIEYRVVLHQVSIAGAVLGLAVGIYLRGIVVTLIGGAVGYIVMYLFYKLGEVFVRWVSKRRGEELDEVALGFGDVNLSGVVGLFLGWPPIVLGLFIAVFGGGLVSILFVLISMVFRRFRAFAAMPYAPFLALAALVMLFFPNEVAALMPASETTGLLLTFPLL
jgi:prepilin signal peptidase PulO-like enzyme (type II secretory pathway)